MVLETAAERGERFGAVTRVAQQLGIGPESQRTWVHLRRSTAGGGRGLTTEERERMTQLEREHRELRLRLKPRIGPVPPVRSASAITPFQMGTRSGVQDRESARGARWIRANTTRWGDGGIPYPEINALGIARASRPFMLASEEPHASQSSAAAHGS